MRGQESRPVQRTRERRPRVAGGDRRALHAPVAEAFAHAQAGVAEKGARPLGAWRLLVPVRPAAFRPRTGDSLRSHDTSVAPRRSPVHALLPARPVSRSPPHLMAQGQWRWHASYYADAAAGYAPDGTVAVLPRGHTPRRAIAPWSRSSTENAPTPAF